MSREDDKEKLKKLCSWSEDCYINWREAGGGQVFRARDQWFLFEIPQYGGEGRYVGAFSLDELDKLLDIAYSWT